MKKKILRLTALLLCLLLLGASFCSCASLVLRFSSEEKRPMRLYNIAMTYMNLSRSATIDSSCKFTTTVNGTKLTLSTEVNEQILTKRSTLLHRFKTTTVVKNGSQTDITTTLSGYQEDEMYFSSNGNHLKAALTPEEYTAHRQTLSDKSGLVLEFADEECGSKITEQGEDGKWISTYTDFKANYLSRTLASLGSIESLYCENYNVSGLTLTLTSNKKLQPEQIEMSFDFKANNGNVAATLPTLTILIEFSDLNKVDFEMEDLAKYIEVDDLRVLDLLGVWTDDYLARDTASFTANHKALIYTGTSNTVSNEKQDISLSFKNGDAGFTFDLSQTQNNETYRYIYEEGEMNTYYQVGTGTPSQLQTTKMEESSAKAQASSLLALYEFKEGEVNDIEVSTENGQTVYTLLTDPASIKDALLDSLGDNAKNFTLTSTYKIYTDADGLDKYTYTLRAKFEINKLSYTYVIETSATYQ